MGDTSGEIADRLHLLRLDELHLEMAPVGDVLKHTDELGRLAPASMTAQGRPPLRTVAPRRPELDLEPFADFERASDGPPHEIAIRRVNLFQ